jgi:hypothetical protein
MRRIFKTSTFAPGHEEQLQSALKSHHGKIRLLRTKNPVGWQCRISELAIAGAR